MKYRMTKIKEWACVGVAISASVWLQLLTLAKWNVWHDESFTAMLIKYNWWSIVERTARDVHPPLYYFVLKAWSALFGSTEVAFRSLSVTLTVVVLVCTYVLVKRLFGLKPALFSLITLTLAPFMIRYGQEARMYPLAALFVVIQAHAFLSLLRGDRRRRILVTYIAASVLAFYTHYYALLIVFTEVIYIVSLQKGLNRSRWWSRKSITVKAKQTPRMWLKLWLGIAVGIAPWLPIAIRQSLEIQSAFWIRWVSQDSFYSTLTSYLFFKDSYNLYRYAVTGGLLAVGCLVLLCVKITKTEKKLRTPLLLLGGYFVGPVILLFVQSLVTRSTYFDRYFVSFAPAFYAFLGVALYFAIAHRYWHVVIRAVVVAVLLGSLILGVYRVNTVGDYDGNRGQYTMREIMNYVHCNGPADDAVIASGLGVYFDALFYSKDPQIPKVVADASWDGWGNGTLVYDRTDLLVVDLYKDVSAGSYVWFVDGAYSNMTLPPNWQKTDKFITSGYAKATRYFITYSALGY